PWHLRQFSLKAIVSFLGLFCASVVIDSITIMKTTRQTETGTFMKMREKRDIILVELVEQLAFYAKKKKRVF
ncbi:MAG: hypothetical protein ACOYLO_17135, partial [Ferruginibacter sp.]